MPFIGETGCRRSVLCPISTAMRSTLTSTPAWAWPRASGYSVERPSAPRAN